MEGAGFLKTVSFGGFDKKDVLQYVDKLNTQIYTLENELNEKKALLESAGTGDAAATEKYEQLLNENRTTITELQTSNESLKNQLKNAEDEAAAKDKEIEELKAKLAAMEDELIDAKNKAAASSQTEANAMDLSNVFMQAQNTANSIVTSAKENARKMDEDARKLANQVVDDANSKASTIVKSADEKALKIVNDAETRSEQLKTASENMKAVVLAEVEEIAQSVNQVKAILDSFTVDGLSKITQTSQLLANTESTLKKNGIPQFTAPKSAKPAPAPQPPKFSQPAQVKPVQPVAPAQPAPAAQPVQNQPKPAPAPAQPKVAQDAAAALEAAQAVKPVSQPQAQPAPAPAPAPAQPKPAPKLNNFGFDMAELEKLTKGVEADATKGKPVDDGYDGNVDPKNIRISKM
ncbi:MAG: hypothetical protein IJ251_05135 [Oscillospiraceae bacterium]|nr:hypothetical protein [Oscillospiraceae bacterium]